MFEKYVMEMCCKWRRCVDIGFIMENFKHLQEQISISQLWKSWWKYIYQSDVWRAILNISIYYFLFEIQLELISEVN